MQAFDIDPNAGLPSRAVVREWRGRVPATRAGDYLAYMGRTGLKGYAATAGHRGTWVLAENGADATEFVLLTVWESREAIRAFAGEDIGRARYYEADRCYLLAMPPRLRHYELLLGP